MVCKKASRALWGLRRKLRSGTPLIKSLAYTTLIRPIIEYAKIVWDPHTAINRHKLDRVQRLAARFIFNKYRRCYSPTELCRNANLPALELRTAVERLKFLFLIVHNKLKINGPDFFRLSPNPRFRHRHSMYIEPPLTRIDSFKYSYFPRVINEWNMLPDSLVSSSSISAFLNELHTLAYSGHSAFTNTNH